MRNSVRSRVNWAYRILEVEQQLQTLADKLEVVIGDRDTMQETRDAYEKARDTYKQERDSYKQARDCFKGKYETSESELSVVKAKLLAYRTQGFWGRLLGRVPY